MMFSNEDLMVVALSEATKVHPRQTLPNPRVGAAILTKAGKLYFSHHQKAGQPHAEIEAINLALKAGADLEGASIAVTLEPCSHTGRTPPCVDALIKAQFARVIVGVRDPDPRVNGAGIARLRDAGIEVIENVMQERAIEINKEWIYSKQHSLPYVYLKMATSLDGLWTSQSGESKWITGSEARSHAHGLRTNVGCMISSLKTLVADDANFSARDAAGELLAFQPDLAIVSRQSDWGKAWQDLCFAAQEVPDRQLLEWRSGDFKALLAKIHDLGHVSCLVEAGPTFTTQILLQSLVQEIWHYQGAQILGGQGLRLGAMNSGQLPGLRLKTHSVTRFGDGDFVVRSFLT